MWQENYQLKPCSKRWDFGIPYNFLKPLSDDFSYNKKIIRLMNLDRLCGFYVESQKCQCLQRLAFKMCWF
jgi:hypothetical protein